MVLLVTLVLLVALSTLGYTLTSRVSARRHRDQYIIDYQAARYGCDSAVKYALATLEDVNAILIERPNEPDFSDLFSLSELEYEDLLDQWLAALWVPEQRPDDFDKNDIFSDINDINNIDDIATIADFNTQDADMPIDYDSLIVRGPYGPPWPYITEPVEFEIGSATVTIRIEDENAKYPIGWAILDDDTVQREAEAGFDTFCEWMGMAAKQIGDLKPQLEQVADIKPFKLELKPISIRTPRKGTTIKKGKVIRGSRFTTTVISPAAQAADYAKLFHSFLLDLEDLARPTLISDRRKESALKYIGMWGSSKVNINTAPRHVLEAAFMFGGDADKIAEEIIQYRLIEPFKDVEELREKLFKYSESIEKCEQYIVTASNFFTIRVTVVSGVAEASAVIAITKNADTIEQIAVVNSG